MTTRVTYAAWKNMKSRNRSQTKIKELALNKRKKWTAIIKTFQNRKITIIKNIIKILK